MGCKDFDKHIDNKVYNYSLFGKEEIKGKVIDKLGFFPTSVLVPDDKFSKQYKNIINDKSQTRKSKNSNRSDRRNGVNDGKTSVFNPDLARKIISLYAKKNCSAIDPFAGGGTRAYISSKMGLKYVGYEIRKEEVDRINIENKKWGLDFKIIVDDSENINDIEKYEFGFTCPPYYDLEQYSFLENDLSNMNSYSEFLQKLQRILNKVYLSLKNNSFFIVVVGNFRDKDGTMFNLNGDTITIGKSVGFKFWDEIIWNRNSNVALTRCGKFEKNKKIIRMHEYILVFKKMEVTKNG